MQFAEKKKKEKRNFQELLIMVSFRVFVNALSNFTQKINHVLCYETTYGFAKQQFQPSNFSQVSKELAYEGGLK